MNIMSFLRGKRPDCDTIRDYMYEINCRLNEIGFTLTGGTQSRVDVTDVVPLSLMQQDAEFAAYIRESNDSLGERQVVGLAKIAAFAKDHYLREHRQAEIKEQCLDVWRVPNEARRAPQME